MPKDLCLQSIGKFIYDGQFTLGRDICSIPYELILQEVFDISDATPTRLLGIFQKRSDM